MVTTFTRQRIADYGKWKKVFDENERVARQYGMTSYTLHRDADDPNVVIVAGHGPDLARAREYFASPDLRAAMERAGVQGPPEIWITEDIEG